MPFIKSVQSGNIGGFDEVDDEDPDGSCMTRLICDEMLLYKMSTFEADNETDSPTFGQIKIDIYKLIVLGVLLCFGSPELKSRVLYNCIQTHI